ncbi:MAG TPA: MBL fold metallo-hydrolase [Anaerolineae bacterium]|nr:MBL fold metallo-hydrolase [Anaerolineae bacterium]
MTQLNLQTRQVGPWGMNTYALICPETNQSVLIDPGDDPDTLQEMLGDSQPIAILLTHTHIDHIGALDEMRQRLNVPVVGNDGPHEPLGKDVGLDQVLRDGDSFTVGQHTLRIYYAPGHIGDQICFAIEDDNRIVVGDTIFEGGPGRTWSAEGFQTTLQTLQNVVLAWPDETVCYPGHGNAFRLGDVRPAVTAFLAKDHGDFYGDAVWDM